MYSREREGLTTTIIISCQNNPMIMMDLRIYHLVLFDVPRKGVYYSLGKEIGNLKLATSDFLFHC